MPFTYENDKIFLLLCSIFVYYYRQYKPAWQISMRSGYTPISNKHYVYNINKFCKHEQSDLL